MKKYFLLCFVLPSYFMYSGDCSVEQNRSSMRLQVREALKNHGLADLVKPILENIKNQKNIYAWISLMNCVIESEGIDVSALRLCASLFVCELPTIPDHYNDDLLAMSTGLSRIRHIWANCSEVQRFYEDERLVKIRTEHRRRSLNARSDLFRRPLSIVEQSKLLEECKNLKDENDRLKHFVACNCEKEYMAIWETVLKCMYEDHWIIWNIWTKHLIAKKTPLLEAHLEALHKIENRITSLGKDIHRSLAIINRMQNSINSMIGAINSYMKDGDFYIYQKTIIQYYWCFPPNLGTRDQVLGKKPIK